MSESDSGAKTYTQEDLDQEVKGLKDKNEELLRKLKAAQDSIEPWKGLDPEKVSKALDELDSLKRQKAEDEGDYKKLMEEQKEQHQKELEKRDAQIAGLKKQHMTGLQRAAIDEAIREGNIASPYQAAFGSLVKDKLVIVGEGEDAKAQIGELSAAEWAKQFAQSDEGKHFVRAEADTGGGSPGQGSPPAGPAGSNPWSKEGWSITKQMELVRADPGKADKMARAAGTTIDGGKPPQ